MPHAMVFYSILFKYMKYDSDASRSETLQSRNPERQKGKLHAEPLHRAELGRNNELEGKCVYNPEWERNPV